MTPIKVAGILTFPFFPMRPTRGTTIMSEADKAVLLEKRSKDSWFLQPKLNGDRALLAKVNNQILIANRHGSLLKHPVSNVKAFDSLPNNTVLDGEVEAKVFMPFEVIIINGKSLMAECPTVRAKEAEKVCKMCSVPWIFGTPTVEWIMGGGKDKRWEGVVAKRKHSIYVPLANERQESVSWFKHKWVL